MVGWSNPISIQRCDSTPSTWCDVNRSICIYPHELLPRRDEPRVGNVVLVRLAIVCYRRRRGRVFGAPAIEHTGSRTGTPDEQKCWWRLFAPISSWKFISISFSFSSSDVVAAMQIELEVALVCCHCCWYCCCCCTAEEVVNRIGTNPLPSRKFPADRFVSGGSRIQTTSRSNNNFHFS